jgi:hypothetical protein
MASHKKILNISTNKLFKRSQAERFISAGSCDWVQKGHTIRDLDRAERLAQFALRQSHTDTNADVLPPSEGQGLVWRPPTSSQTPRGEISALVVAARQFCEVNANHPNT